MPVFESLGQALFRSRNLLFPATLGLLLVAFPPRPLAAGWDWQATGGVLLVLAGQGLRVLTIGLAYIRRGGKDGRIHASGLVTGGLFAHSRNPMYSGNLLIILGYLTVAGRPGAIVVGGLLFALFYSAIIHSEERYLRRLFGSAYRRYCEHVPRWWPRWRGLAATLRAHRFDWPAVVVREYGTLYPTLLMTLGLLAWKSWRAQTLAQHRAWILALVTLATVGYLVARFMKKSRRLQARADSQPVEPLQTLRQRIDEVDRLLLELLNERAGLVRQIFDAKDQRGERRYDPERTRTIIERLQGRNAGPLTDEQVEQVFGAILHFYAFQLLPPAGSIASVTSMKRGQR